MASLSRAVASHMMWCSSFTRSSPAFVRWMEFAFLLVLKTDSTPEVEAPSAMNRMRASSSTPCLRAPRCRCSATLRCHAQAVVAFSVREMCWALGLKSRSSASSACGSSSRNWARRFRSVAQRGPKCWS
eukprot:11998613-Alexandrium_andersonii.AAC.1